MTMQDLNGDTAEFSFILSFKEFVEKLNKTCNIENNSRYHVAKRNFKCNQNKFLFKELSDSAVNKVCDSKDIKNFLSHSDAFEISLVSDIEGKNLDSRDCIIRNSSQEEIGFQIKHNNLELKSPRISKKQSDFVKKITLGQYYTSPKITNDIEDLFLNLYRYKPNNFYDKIIDKLASSLGSVKRNKDFAKRFRTYILGQQSYDTVWTNTKTMQFDVYRHPVKNVSSFELSKEFYTMTGGYSDVPRLKIQFDSDEQFDIRPHFANGRLEKSVKLSISRQLE